MRLLLLASAVLLALPVSAQKQVPPSGPSASLRATDCTIGEAEADLDVGGVRARLFNIGGLFWRGRGSTYEVPRGTGLSPVFNASLWVGGMVSDSLHFAGSTYGPWSFWPGPLDANGETTPETCAAFDRIWTVTTSDLETYDATGDVTPDLEDWPVAVGAPFYTDANRNGQQDPSELTVSLDLGDDGYGTRRLDLEGDERPVIFGRQTAWWVMNDAGGEHEWFPAPALGIEVQVTAWTHGGEDALDLYESTFYRYEIINRNDAVLEDMIGGLFVDADLGEFNDDLTHSDSTRQMLVFYNGDEFDDGGGGYGTAPPALGVDVLSRSDGSVHYEKSFGGDLIGSPQTAEDAYGYLLGLRPNDEPLREGGFGFDSTGAVTRWSYPGDPVARAFWSEENVDGAETANTPRDRQVPISFTETDLEPGDRQTVDVAILFARGESRLGSVTALRATSDRAQALYDAGDLLRAVPSPPAPTASPVLEGPADRLLVQDTPTFRWQPVAGATHYVLEVSPFPSFEDTVGTQYPRTRRLTIDGLEAEAPEGWFPTNSGASMYWRVIASNLGVLGPPSELREVVFYRYRGEVLTFSDGVPAVVEVASPSGIDPCGSQATSTVGCVEVGGNGVWNDPNSDGRYLVTSEDSSSGPFYGRGGPAEVEVRFTERGSFAFALDRDRLFHVPFEVWDIGVVTPGAANDPSDDRRLIPEVFDHDPGGSFMDPRKCSFTFGDVTIDGRSATNLVYGARPGESGYDAFETAAAPLVEGAGGCYDDPSVYSLWFTYLDTQTPAVLSQISFAALGPGQSVTDLEGAVVRFYTTDPDPPLPLGPRDPEPGPPEQMALSVRPNPLSGAGRIVFDLPTAGPVRLRIVSVLGREVAVLEDGDRREGTHALSLEVDGLASGVYLVVLEAGGERASRTMTVVR